MTRDYNIILLLNFHLAEKNIPYYSYVCQMSLFLITQQRLFYVTKYYSSKNLYIFSLFALKLIKKTDIALEN